MDNFETQVEQDKNDELATCKLKAALKKLKSRDFAPMLYLKETLQYCFGDLTDNYVTDPIQVDRVAREAWNPIYAGNVRDTKQHCGDVLCK